MILNVMCLAKHRKKEKEMLTFFLCFKATTMLLFHFAMFTVVHRGAF